MQKALYAESSFLLKYRKNTAKYRKMMENTENENRIKSADNINSLNQKERLQFKTHFFGRFHSADRQQTNNKLSCFAEVSTQDSFKRL